MQWWWQMLQIFWERHHKEKTFRMGYENWPGKYWMGIWALVRRNVIFWILEYNTEIILILMIRPLVQLRGLTRFSHWTRRSLCYEDRMNLSRILSGIVSTVNLQSFSCVLCSEIRLGIIRRSTMFISTRSISHVSLVSGSGLVMVIVSWTERVEGWRSDS